jgi:hypothetical protein
VALSSDKRDYEDWPESSATSFVIASTTLYADSLDLIEGNLIIPAVVQPGSPGRFMRRHLLRNLQPAAVIEVRRYAGRPKGVTADLSFYSCRLRSTANHSPHI